MQNENKDTNLPRCLKDKSRVSSCKEIKRVTFSLEKQSSETSIGRNSPTSLRGKKRVSLPKVLKNVFPEIETIPIVKRKITSAHPSSMRYLEIEQDPKLMKNFSMSFQKADIFRDTRPKSVMLLSEMGEEIPEQKIKTIQYHSKKVCPKVQKVKNDDPTLTREANNKIEWNINELKKIYR